LFTVFHSNLLANYFTRPAISDYVTQQVALRHIFEYGHYSLALPAGNFLIHVPIYLLSDILFSNPEVRILVTQFLLNAIYICISVSVILYYWKRNSNKYQVLKFKLIIWLGSLAGDYIYNLSIINSRSLSLGLTLLIVLATDIILRKSIEEKQFNIEKTKLLALVIATGIMIFNDPFSLYFFIAPLMLYIFLYYFYTRKKVYLKMLGVFSASIVIYAVIDYSATVLLRLVTSSAELKIIYPEDLGGI